MNLEPLFEPGDHVTFRAMLRVQEEGGGPPCRLVVVAGRVYWDQSGHSISYYCRGFASGKHKWHEQDFAHGQPKANGLLLIQQQELVAYPAPADGDE